MATRWTLRRFSSAKNDFTRSAPAFRHYKLSHRQQVKGCELMGLMNTSEMARSGGGDPQHRSAFIAAVASFATWGLVPIYWKLLSRVPALEILAHRFVWTIVFLGLLLSWQERWREVIGNLHRRRSALFCLGSGIMVGLNWLLFIWAVNIGHVLETSLGYFMTPIVNVLLGAFILRERLSAWQTASILIAFFACLYSCLWLRPFPVDRARALHQFRPLRIAAEAVRHRCHSWAVFGNALSPAAGPGLSSSSRQSRCADLWPLAPFPFRHPNNDRDRDRRPADLVRLRPPVICD